MFDSLKETNDSELEPERVVRCTPFHRLDARDVDALTPQFQVGDSDEICELETLGLLLADIKDLVLSWGCVDRSYRIAYYTRKRPEHSPIFIVDQRWLARGGILIVSPRIRPGDPCIQEMQILKGGGYLFWSVGNEAERGLSISEVIGFVQQANMRQVSKGGYDPDRGRLPLMKSVPSRPLVQQFIDRARTVANTLTQNPSASALLALSRKPKKPRPLLVGLS